VLREQLWQRGTLFGDYQHGRLAATAKEIGRRPFAEMVSDDAEHVVGLAYEAARPQATTASAVCPDDCVLAEIRQLALRMTTESREAGERGFPSICEGQSTDNETKGDVIVNI
jgi:hypothetical protein